MRTSCGISSAGKAPEDWRTPKRFAYFNNHRVAPGVLDCGGPPPLFPEAYQTVLMLTGTAMDALNLEFHNPRQRGGSVTTNSQNDSMDRTTFKNCWKSTGLVM